MKSTSHGIVDRAHEVGEEEHRALEDADEQQVATVVVAGDLGAELADAVLELVGLDEDLADHRVAHGARDATRLGAAAVGCAHQRSTPASTTARAPSPRSSAPSSSARTSSSRAGGARAQRARRVLGQPAQHEARRAPRGSAASVARAIAVAAAERGGDDLVEHRRLVAQQLRGAKDVGARRAVVDGLQRGHQVLAHAGARVPRGRRWWGPRATPGRGPAQWRAVSARVAPAASSGRTRRPPVGLHPQQRAAPRRGRQPVEDGLDLVGRRVAGGDAGAVGRRVRQPRRRSGRRAPRPGRRRSPVA